VLEIITELSPCPEPTLFVVAATRGLQRFANGSLEDLGKLLRKCLQELKSRGLVEIKGEQLVIPTAGSRGDERILDQMAGVESRPQSLKEKPTVGSGDDIIELTAELEFQPQSVTEKSARDILDLTAELQLHDVDHLLELTAELEFQPQSVRETSARDILNLTAELELQQAEDLLELTAALEFPPSLRPSKLHKASRDQRQLQTQAQGKGPKGAAEPTREEMIAAMRRFISDE
jgi:hypothetical protein